ncbi:SDR family NAD(P)-dependent oxidoreductase [Variovorax sp. GB1R11]|uniref:SDR family NAD(P)-dependent oxidoreductase n=1 Tax=Variovorax sp. GB1R11 TaxID=3443741 RepID=UPI003F481008
MKRLEGRVAVVTGAASGIGAATARLFEEEGARVLAVDRDAVLLAETHAGRDGIRTLAQDLTGEDAPRAVVSGALAAFGAIDILFNNAGTSANSLAEAMTDAQWDFVLDVNLRSMFRLTREAVPALKQQAAKTGRARILNTSSVMARDTDIGLAAYTASKHGVAGLTKTLALELGKFGITANHILPGAIVTGLTRRSFGQAHISAVWEKKAALRRLGQPVDIARAALLLASDEADFITGHGLVVDGGLTLRA